MQPTAGPDIKPLPQGYLWRVMVVISLFLGASICFLFVNSIVGSILMLCGLAFGKFSSLHALESEVIAQNATENAVETLPKHAEK